MAGLHCAASSRLLISRFAVCLCARLEALYGILVQLILLADMAHGLLGGQLLALLLGLAEAGAELEPLDAYAAAEGGAVGAHGVLVHEFEHDAVLRLLAPLDELALEVVVLLGHLLEVDVLAYQLMQEEAVAPGIATVEVDGAHQCLEGVAGNEAVVGAVDMGGLYETDQPCLLGNAVEAAALHYLAAHGGEEALFLAGELVVEDVAHHGLDDGIAQVFEPLIVFLLLARTVVVERAVHQGLAVDGYVARIEPKDTAELAAELLVVAEKVMYVVGYAGDIHGCVGVCYG